MTSESLIRRPCGDKIRHASINAAWAAAVRLAAEAGDRYLRAYRCEFCRAWHVGHSSKRYRNGRESK